MTLEELSKRGCLVREIQEHNAQKEKLEKALSRMATRQMDVVTGSDTDAPYRQHTIKVSGARIKRGRAAEYHQKRGELHALNNLILEKEEQCFAEYCKLMRYILTSVDESLLRQIMMGRFVDGLSWGEVASYVGGEYSEDKIKKYFFRKVKRL